MYLNKPLKVQILFIKPLQRRQLTTNACSAFSFLSLKFSLGGTLHLLTSQWRPTEVAVALDVRKKLKMRWVSVDEACKLTNTLRTAPVRTPALVLIAVLGLSASFYLAPPAPLQNRLDRQEFEPTGVSVRILLLNSRFAYPGLESHSNPISSASFDSTLSIILQVRYGDSTTGQRRCL